jgi:hypothetical protein
MRICVEKQLILITQQGRQKVYLEMLALRLCTTGIAPLSYHAEGVCGVALRNPRRPTHAESHLFVSFVATTPCTQCNA